jgi:hypothetical protein
VRAKPPRAMLGLKYDAESVREMSIKHGVPIVLRGLVGDESRYLR